MKHITSLLALWGCSPLMLLAQTHVTVEVQPQVAQHYGEVTSLDREKFFGMHESPGSISYQEVLDIQALGSSMGRGTFSPFAGYHVVHQTSDEEIRTQAQKWINSLKQKKYPLSPDLMKGSIMTSHPTEKHGAAGKYAFQWKGLGADYSDEARYAERFFRITFLENGLNLPTYYEPMNEPFVKANSIEGVPSHQVITEMCRYHQQLNRHLKKQFPQMKVGGFASAWPLFEGFNSDFQHWDRRMKQYIDIAGDDSDFLSFHIYDGRNVTGEETYRSGSNMEGLIDIIENYTAIKFGKPKPILISEHGMTHKGMVGYPWTPERDWKIIEALNHQSVQFIQRPANLEKVLPFILVKGLWGRQNGHPYPWVLQHQDGQGGWKSTDLYRYYEFWQDLKGDYVFTQSSEIDVLSLAFAHKDQLQIVLNNLEQDIQVNLAIEELRKNKLKKLTLKSLFAVDGVATIQERRLSVEELQSLTLRQGETVMITAEYAKSIEAQQTLCSKRFYADTYLKPIKKGENQQFELKIDQGKIAYATLKVGVARPSGMAINPVLKVGNKPYPFPTDWKGYDQKNRTKDGYFGVIDVVINPEDLQQDNTISLTFPSDGGTVSTVGIDVNYL